jgi:dihydrofolate synthase / folylpolyglutamate synthase
MNYQECIERLFERTASTKMHYDLHLMQALDHYLDAPSTRFPCIHVAGSNGKGSVATKIAHALMLSGYRVGLYTSPHLYTFRERILCNEEPIPEESVTQLLEPIFRAEKALNVALSFFELTTLLCFSYFRSHVDIAVIETGLGGRLDATNIIKPLSTIITSISREHSHILGDELERIAAEKAGIIKPKTPLILGPNARFRSIEKRAAELQAPLYFSTKTSSFFDEENSGVAEVALRHLPFSLSEEAIKEGCMRRPACRFEQCGDTIFDVAHNPDAFVHLLQALNTFFPKRRLHFVVGFSADKDYKSCLELIASVAEHIHLVEANSHRAAKLSLLAALMEQIKKPYTLHLSVKEGVGQARVCALQSGALLVVAGSFYLMADAKEAHSSYPTRDTLPLSDVTLVSCSSLKT